MTTWLLKIRVIYQWLIKSSLHFKIALYDVCDVIGDHLDGGIIVPNVCERNVNIPTHLGFVLELSKILFLVIILLRDCHMIDLDLDQTIHSAEDIFLAKFSHRVGERHLTANTCIEYFVRCFQFCRQICLRNTYMFVFSRVAGQGVFICFRGIVDVFIGFVFSHGAEWRCRDHLTIVCPRWTTISLRKSVVIVICVWNPNKFFVLERPCCDVAAFDIRPIDMQIKVAEDDIAFKLAILKKVLHWNDNTCFCSIIQSSKLVLGSLLAKNNFFVQFWTKTFASSRMANCGSGLPAEWSFRSQNAIEASDSPLPGGLWVKRLITHALCFLAYSDIAWSKLFLIFTMKCLYWVSFANKTPYSVLIDYSIISKKLTLKKLGWHFRAKF